MRGLLPPLQKPKLIGGILTTWQWIAQTFATLHRWEVTNQARRMRTWSHSREWRRGGDFDRATYHLDELQMMSAISDIHSIGQQIE